MSDEMEIKLYIVHASLLLPFYSSARHGRGVRSSQDRDRREEDGGGRREEDGERRVEGGRTDRREERRMEG